MTGYRTQVLFDALKQARFNRMANYERQRNMTALVQENKKRKLFDHWKKSLLVEKLN